MAVADTAPFAAFRAFGQLLSLVGDKVAPPARAVPMPAKHVGIRIIAIGVEFHLHALIGRHTRHLRLSLNQVGTHEERSVFVCGD